MRLLSSALLAASLSLSAILPASAQTSDVRYLAANCANCHGTDGRAAAGAGMPGLAGLSPAYFVEQMNAFRDGKRQATIMHQISKGYTDAQIAAMAQFFAAQKADK